MKAQDQQRPAVGRLRYMLGRAHWGLRRAARDSVRFVFKHYLSPALQSYVIVFRERRRRALSQRFLALYQDQGIKAVLERLRRSVPKSSNRNKILVAIARNLISTNVVDSEQAIRALVSDTDRSDMLKWATFAAWDSGSIRFASELLEEFDGLERESAEIGFKVRQIRGSRRLFECLPEIPAARPAPAYESCARDILYVASSSRPYHITGYTSRTHHILRAIKTAGWNVRCVTRPGYPFDRPDARDVSEQLVHEIDGLVYERLPGAHRREVDYDDYLWQSADVIEQAALRFKPSLIQAASNYEAALPALIAARRLGIPFVYEVRGLWEYTAASKKPGWEFTERFELDRRLEGLAASHADHVFTLTSALADELVKRGVQPKFISLAPNGIEPDEFRPMERDQAAISELGLPGDAFIVGYVGSIVAYEGLDDLIGAVRLLIADYPSLRVVIVGDGDARVRLAEQVKRYALGSHVIFTGKVPPDAVSRYFSIFDAISLPRKPYQVCRLVSPLKPLEAMAMNVPMIVSDVEALREMVEDGVSALVHKSGDVESLAGCIRLLMTNPGLASELTKHARSQMLPARTWNKIAREMSRELDREIS